MKRLFHVGLGRFYTELEMLHSDSRIREKFGVASQMRPEDRAEYLDRACNGSEDIRREVESLSETNPWDFLRSAVKGKGWTSSYDFSQFVKSSCCS